MKVLAIGDLLITEEMMAEGLQELNEAEIMTAQWRHDTLAELQSDNLFIEQNGPNDYPLPDYIEVILEKEQPDLLVVHFFPVSKTLLKRFPTIKQIGILRGGIENIDSDYVKENKITIQNVPGRNAQAVAEFTIGLMLCEMKNIHRSHSNLQQLHSWDKNFSNTGNVRELKYLTIGLIGFGKIGRIVKQMLEGFGVSQFLVYDPYQIIEEDNVSQLSLEVVMSRSDVISIHARATKESYHLISKDMLNLMKPTAYLINTARSWLVDEQALIDKLNKKEILGAAIDTFDTEPLPKDSPFLSLDNVTLTAHMAGSTLDAFKQSPKLYSQIMNLKLQKDSR